MVGGVILCVINFSATAALLSKYHKVPSLVATAIFSILAGLLHLAQSIWLCRAIKITQIAREAVNFSQSIMGNTVTGTPTTSGKDAEVATEAVAYTKAKENVVLDPTQTVY